MFYTTNTCSVMFIVTLFTIVRKLEKSHLNILQPGNTKWKWGICALLCCQIVIDVAFLHSNTFCTDVQWTYEKRQIVTYELTSTNACQHKFMNKIWTF